jgi:hypothetical protein
VIRAEARPQSGTEVTGSLTGRTVRCTTLLQCVTCDDATGPVKLRPYNTIRRALGYTRNLPPFFTDAVAMMWRPFLRRRFSVFLPCVVFMRVRKPDTPLECLQLLHKCCCAQFCLPPRFMPPAQSKCVTTS